RVAVACSDYSPVFDQLGDVTGFSTWGRACIEDLFSGVRIQNLAGDYGAWILNVAMTPADSGRGYDAKFDEAGTTDHRAGLWVMSEEFFLVDSKLINSSVDRSGKIVPFAEFFCVFDPVGLLPARDQKLRMRCSNE